MTKAKLLKKSLGLLRKLEVYDTFDAEREEINTTIKRLEVWVVEMEKTLNGNKPSAIDVAS